jgi:protein-S-isoprenylcysteine O-methyltransferase Ste14
MYLGSVVMYPATALMLGSGWAMAVAAPIVVLIVWRTHREDHFLHEQLAGYAQFASRTRFRLIPGLW